MEEPMDSKSSLAARQCRIQEWAQMIHDWNNRKSGMSADEWRQSNGLTKSNYYYRLRQVRNDWYYRWSRRKLFEYDRKMGAEK